MFFFKKPKPIATPVPPVAAKKRGRPPKSQQNSAANSKEAVMVANGLTDNSSWLKTKGQLAVDVYQTETEFCIQAPVAGVEPGDIAVAVENEMLIIKGDRPEPETKEGRRYIYQECFWGAFSRQIILPEDVDASSIKASLKKGILTIKIPRIGGDKKKIKITIEQ
jgi:HSP20 family protein